MLDTKGCRGQLMNIAQRLLSIDSPSGFTDQVVREAEQIARDHGYAVRRTNKGNLVVSVPGREKGKRVGLCAHIDTLGLMVRSITADGMLMTTRIGGPILPPWTGSTAASTPGTAGYTPEPSCLCPRRPTSLTTCSPAAERRTWPCASTRWWRTGPAWRPGHRPR